MKKKIENGIYKIKRIAGEVQARLNVVSSKQLYLHFVNKRVNELLKEKNVK